MYRTPLASNTSDGASFQTVSIGCQSMPKHTQFPQAKQPPPRFTERRFVLLLGCCGRGSTTVWFAGKPIYPRG